MNENQMILIDELGNEVVMDILFTFSSDETGKSYVLYFNAEAEQPEIYASIFSDDGQLSQIEDPTEWAMVEEVYAGFMDQKEGCGCGSGCGCHDGDEDHECCGGHGDGECGCNHGEEDHACGCN